MTGCQYWVKTGDNGKLGVKIKGTGGTQFTIALPRSCQLAWLNCLIFLFSLPVCWSRNCSQLAKIWQRPWISSSKAINPALSSICWYKIGRIFFYHYCENDNCKKLVIFALLLHQYCNYTSNCTVLKHLKIILLYCI